jgi:hypothetical protein
MLLCLLDFFLSLYSTSPYFPLTYIRIFLHSVPFSLKIKILFTLSNTVGPIMGVRSLMGYKLQTTPSSAVPLLNSWIYGFGFREYVA